MDLSGLTDTQVKERIEKGRVNYPSKKTQNTIPKIILKNTLTVFNLVNLILAIMILIVGSYKNLLFILIAIANTLISIINGIRAKKTVDKMRLIAEQRPTVIRNGQTIQIDQNSIVKDDLLIYSLGDQIIVDSVIKQATIEVNESYITGEQDNITKTAGDQLFSGSFVVSGTCKATATAVGESSELRKIESTARTIKTADSKLFTILNNIVRYISYLLIPIGALLLWSRFRLENTTPEIAVTSTVAALISMIPEGLILLTSSVLALATIRLSKKQVLVQDLYSVETLARVDCIALDKTGTLTTGKMTVKDFIPINQNGELLGPTNTRTLQTSSEKSLLNALTLILSATETDNATSAALRRKLLKMPKFKPTEQIIETIPFSSERKYSGVVTNRSIYLMGATDFLTNDQKLLKLSQSASDGYRIIAVGKMPNIHFNPKKALPENFKLIGFIRLEDEIRSDAKQIIDYFYDNNIEIKIISGDDSVAVTSIAKKVGLKDLSVINLSSEKTHNYEALVQNYSIFTRVKPNEKKHLIEALRKSGKTVAMTGDGVNDILAMKESDCSIAIGEGSDAARRSAKLVLLGNDFGAIPSIIAEGRRSINNLERSATLFLSKTVYASILAVLFVILPLEYPFSPIEMSLLNFLCIGLPGLVLALENNTERVKNQFEKNIKRYSIPTGLLVAVSTLILSIVAKQINLSHSELTVYSSIIVFAIGFLLIYRISKPLNNFRATLLLIILALFATAFAVPFLRSFIFL